MINKQIIKKEYGQNKLTLIGLGVFGCILRRYKRPATDNAMNKYSASTPILNNTNVSWNNKQTRVAALINITETIGVKNLFTNIQIGAMKMCICRYFEKSA